MCQGWLKLAVPACACHVHVHVHVDSVVCTIIPSYLYCGCMVVLDNLVIHHHLQFLVRQMIIAAI